MFPLPDGVARLPRRELVGQARFFKDHALKKIASNHRGVLSGAAVFIVQGVWGHQPHLCNPLNTSVSHFKQRRAKKNDTSP